MTAVNPNCALEKTLTTSIQHKDEDCQHKEYLTTKAVN